MRGGLGFIFPDAHSLINGGRLATNQGKGLQAAFDQNQDTHLQGLETSAAWANGRMGLGTSIKRLGTDLLDKTTSTDVVKAQVGLVLGKGQFSLGALYSNHRESTDFHEKNISGQFNFYLGKTGRSAILGINAGTTLGEMSKTYFGTIGLGRAFGKHFMIEGSFQIDDFSQLKNHYRYSGSILYQGRRAYFAAQYNLITTPEGNPDNAVARLGLILKRADVSAHIKQETFTGGYTTYGGTLRYLF